MKTYVFFIVSLAFLSSCETATKPSADFTAYATSGSTSEANGTADMPQSHLLMDMGLTMMHANIADSPATFIRKNGKGRIARHADTKEFTYTLEDATHAYNEKVTRYRRHFIHLRPSYLVVYDELEATIPVKCAWVLQSHYPVTYKEDPLRLACDNGKGRCEVNLFAAQPLGSKTHDPSSANSHCQVEVSNQDEASALRFLAIFRVSPQGEAERMPLLQTSQGGYILGRWTVQAELFRNKEPRLYIFNKENEGIFYNTEEGKYARSTLIRTKEAVKELCDTPPD